MLQIINYLVSIIDKINTLYPILSPAVFVLIFLFDREKLKIKFESVASFIAFLALFGAIKMCIWNGFVFQNKFNLSLRNFLFVFLEDAFYVMIPFYLTKRINNKTLNVVIWSVFSVLFGVAHRYQGIAAVFVTATYPYFISNKFAQKTSFGTVMSCHFLWDCFVFLLPIFNNMVHVLGG